MIKHLLKGILRDRSRSLLPIIIITIGVTLTIVLSGYMKGAFGDMIDQNASFDTGHVKIMTKPYLENKALLPNDLALLGVGELVDSLEKTNPEYTWTKRVRFGGLIDAVDSNGESQGQGPAAGLAVDLFNNESGEVERMSIQKSLAKGTVPTSQGEVLLADAFSLKLNVDVGDTVTFFGTTMNGSMTMQNFVVTGTVFFGTPALDRGAFIVDISDAQQMLDMEDGAGEVLGFLKSNIYSKEETMVTKQLFNASFENDSDEFAPVMQTLRDQNGLAELIDYADSISGAFISIFILAMSLVLWNTGLLGGLRRYNEFGIRLALGESKGHIYRAMMLEAFIIGVIGSVIGTTIGVLLTYWLQVVGLDMSGSLENSNMLMSSIIRAKVTPNLYFIGFIPGVLAMVLGNMLSGIGIYKRSTAALFKELEV